MFFRSSKPQFSGMKSTNTRVASMIMVSAVVLSATTASAQIFSTLSPVRDAESANKEIERIESLGDAPLPVNQQLLIQDLNSIERSIISLSNRLEPPQHFERDRNLINNLPSFDAISEQSSSLNCDSEVDEIFSHDSLSAVQIYVDLFGNYGEDSDNRIVKRMLAAFRSPIKRTCNLIKTTFADTSHDEAS